MCFVMIIIFNFFLLRQFGNDRLRNTHFTCRIDFLDALLAVFGTYKVIIRTVRGCQIDNKSVHVLIP